MSQPQKPNIKVVLVSNTPAPYRVPVWQRVARADGIDFEIIYCGQPYIDASLNAEAHGFPTHFLGGRYVAMERRFMHADRGVWRLLNQIKPDVVITTGFVPTYLYAFLWAWWHRIPHIPMTDGTKVSEQDLSWVHRWVRRRVFARSAAFLGASEGSRDLYRQYGIAENRIHTSHLCIENQRFEIEKPGELRDFLFCGRFVDTKQPLFALQVAQETAKRLRRRVSIDLLGSGPLEEQLRSFSTTIAGEVEVRFLGYATQREMPLHYAGARIFLFPSAFDVWGVVANEACAAGLPVIVSPHAGAAGELVLDGINGFVRPLVQDAWVDAALALLQDPRRLASFSESARARVASYNFDRSAQGVIEAIRQGAIQTPNTIRPSFRSPKKIRQVCIIQSAARHYRRPFFDALSIALAACNVELRVVYSDPNPVEALRRDSVDLPASYGVKVPAYWFANHHVLHQAALKHACQADLVIVEQASKHVTNYILHILHALGLVRLAYWGHGRNWQKDGISWMEPIKRFLICHVDWWFAYTSRVKSYVVAAGFPAGRVTNVQNSVDLKRFAEELSAVTPEMKLQLRARLGIGSLDPIGLFCGSLHAAKHPEFLVATATKIREETTNFHLIVVGAGPMEHVVRDAARTNDWIHFVGPAFDADRAPYFSIADLFLCPGLIGLAVLEAFIAGLPVFTTDIPIHSPEVDYLEPGFNGEMTAFDITSFADAVSTCCSNPDRLAQLRLAAHASATRYGLDAMVNNFVEGIGLSLTSARGTQ